MSKYDPAQYGRTLVRRSGDVWHVRPAHAASPAIDDDFEDFAAIKALTRAAGDDDFGYFMAKETPPVMEDDDFGDFVLKEASPGMEVDEFGDFVAKEASPGMEDDEFGDFVAKEASPGMEDDEFGDFVAKEASPGMENDEFGDFVAKEESPVMEDDDFGDFARDEPVTPFDLTQDEQWPPEFRQGSDATTDPRKVRVALAELGNACTAHVAGINALTNGEIAFRVRRDVSIAAVLAEARKSGDPRMHRILSIADEQRNPDMESILEDFMDMLTVGDTRGGGARYAARVEDSKWNAYLDAKEAEQEGWNDEEMDSYLAEWYAAALIMDQYLLADGSRSQVPKDPMKTWENAEPLRRTAIEKVVHEISDATIALEIPEELKRGIDVQLGKLSASPECVSAKYLVDRMSAWMKKELLKNHPDKKNNGSTEVMTAITDWRKFVEGLGRKYTGCRPMFGPPSDGHVNFAAEVDRGRPKVLRSKDLWAWVALPLAIAAPKQGDDQPLRWVACKVDRKGRAEFKGAAWSALAVTKRDDMSGGPNEFEWEDTVGHTTRKATVVYVDTSDENRAALQSLWDECYALADDDGDAFEAAYARWATAAFTRPWHVLRDTVSHGRPELRGAAAERTLLSELGEEFVRGERRESAAMARVLAFDVISRVEKRWASVLSMLLRDDDDDHSDEEGSEESEGEDAGAEARRRVRLHEGAEEEDEGEDGRKLAARGLLRRYCALKLESLTKLNGKNKRAGVRPADNISILGALQFERVFRHLLCLSHPQGYVPEYVQEAFFLMSYDAGAGKLRVGRTTYDMPDAGVGGHEAEFRRLRLAAWAGDPQATHEVDALAARGRDTPKHGVRDPLPEVANETWVKSPSDARRRDVAAFRVGLYAGLHSKPAAMMLATDQIRDVGRGFFVRGDPSPEELSALADLGAGELTGGVGAAKLVHSVLRPSRWTEPVRVLLSKELGVGNEARAARGAYDAADADVQAMADLLLRATDYDDMRRFYVWERKGRAGKRSLLETLKHAYTRALRVSEAMGPDEEGDAAYERCMSDYREAQRAYTFSMMEAQAARYKDGGVGYVLPLLGEAVEEDAALEVVEETRAMERLRLRQPSASPRAGGAGADDDTDYSEEEDDEDDGSGSDSDGDAQRRRSAREKRAAEREEEEAESHDEEADSEDDDLDELDELDEVEAEEAEEDADDLELTAAAEAKDRRAGMALVNLDNYNSALKNPFSELSRAVHARARAWACKGDTAEYTDGISAGTYVKAIRWLVGVIEKEGTPGEKLFPNPEDVRRSMAAYEVEGQSVPTEDEFYDMIDAGVKAHPPKKRSAPTPKITLPLMKRAYAEAAAEVGEAMRNTVVHHRKWLEIMARGMVAKKAGEDVYHFPSMTAGKEASANAEVLRTNVEKFMALGGATGERASTNSAAKVITDAERHLICTLLMALRPMVLAEVYEKQMLPYVADLLLAREYILTATYASRNTEEVSDRVIVTSARMDMPPSETGWHVKGLGSEFRTSTSLSAAAEEFLSMAKIYRDRIARAFDRESVQALEDSLYKDRDKVCKTLVNTKTLMLTGKELLMLDNVHRVAGSGDMAALERVLDASLPKALTAAGEAEEAAAPSQEDDEW